MLDYGKPLRVVLGYLLLCCFALPATEKPADDVKRSAIAAGERLSLVLPEALVDSEIEESARRGGVTAVFVTDSGDASVVVAELNETFDDAIESVTGGRIQGREQSATDVKIAGRSARLYEYRQETNNRTYHRWVLFVPAAEKQKTIMVSANLADGSSVATPADLRRRLLAVEVEGTGAAQQQATTQPNAADVYRKAFAALTIDYTTARDLDDRVRQQGLTPEAIQTAKQNDEAIRLAVEAGALPQADWGVKLDQGPMAELPHISDIRRLTNLMSISARMAAQEGRSGDAAQVLVAMLAAGRHTGDGSFTILELVGYGIEATAAVTAEAIVPQFDQAALEKLRDGVGRLPADQPIADAVRTEGRVIAEWVRRQEQFPRALFTDVLEMKPEPTAAVEKRWPAEYQSWADGYEQFSNQAADALELAPAQRQGALEAVKRARDTSGLFTAVFSGDMQRVVEARERADVKLALLRAAVEILIDGPAAASRHPDPSTGQPFAYEQKGKGFVLRSAKQVDGKPMQFVVNRP